MANLIDYKSKYMELRNKYINDVDTSFQLGYQQGAQQAQMQAQQEMMQQQQAQQMQGGQPGQPDPSASQSGQEDPNAQAAPQSPSMAQPGMPEQATTPAQPEGSELDQHIAKLESLLGQSDNPEVKKSLKALIDIRKSEIQAIQMKKMEIAIGGISKSMGVTGSGPGVFFKSSTPLPPGAVQMTADQQEKSRELSDIIKKMENQGKSDEAEIKRLIGIEGYTK